MRNQINNVQEATICDVRVDEKWKRRRMCASARKDDMMEECMNGNNIFARWRLVSMCVFLKVVSDNVRVFESVVQDA